MFSRKQHVFEGYKWTWAAFEINNFLNFLNSDKFLEKNNFVF